MSTQKPGETGREGAHTLPGSGELAASVAALAQPPEDDQPGLFIDDTDTLAQKVAKANLGRKGPGRPEGSANRRNSDLFDFAMARGYKHPFIRLMEIVSADVKDLGVSRKDGLALQIRAAEALLPFDMAKKPQQIEVKGKSLHVFMAGPLVELGHGAEGFSIFGPDQGLSTIEAEPVGRAGVGRQDNGQQDQQVEPAKPAD